MRKLVPLRKVVPLFALACVAVALFGGPAGADSRIRAGSCDVYQTAVLDPIGLTEHEHDFYMGRVRSNADTGFDLKRRAYTSCGSPGSQWATSGGWSPAGLRANLIKQTVYYRDPGDFRVNPIPTDLRMLSHEMVFNSQGDSTLLTVHFPNCVAVDSAGAPVLDSVDHESHLYDANNGRCPATHPYRIPRTSYLLHFDRTVTPSTLFSMGNGEYGRAGDFFHADYLAGVQDEFNYPTSRGKALIDLCLNDVPNRVNVAHSRCGPEPGR